MEYITVYEEPPITNATVVVHVNTHPNYGGLPSYRSHLIQQTPNNMVVPIVIDYAPPEEIIETTTETLDAIYETVPDIEEDECVAIEKPSKRVVNARKVKESNGAIKREAPEPKTGRFRSSFNLKQWRKQARNSGEEYVTKRNKKVEKKQFENVDCKCRKNCFSKITEDARRQIFNMFWKMGSYTTQNVFLCGLVIQSTPKTRRPRGGDVRKPKSTVNRFRFQVGADSVEVCKEYFLQTLQIKSCRLNTALNKMRLGEQIDKEKRGRHQPVNKIEEDRLDVVRNHIQSFPTHKVGKKKYLPSYLNVSAMYKLYKCDCEQADVPPVDISIYRRVFTKEFKLLFAPAIPKNSIINNVKEGRIE